jgi:bifunctional enzyme CysN/CysC
MSDVRKEQMNIVIVGHVDHGKSTLVGRLLADTGSLPQGKLEAVRRMCALNSKPFEYAFLLDALADEQDQGITIDTARCFFHTERREYIIIDAPGHIEFLKNMISGAARAEAAVLLIDAHEGVRENSRRHGYVLRMLGIQQVVVAVNKMDLVGHSQAAFEAIEAEYRAFLSGIGAVSPRLFIPLSARNGDNVAQRSAQMPWYTGPTVLEALDNFAKAPARQDQPLRFPVQDVYKFTAGGDDRRIVAGRVEAGELKVGDQVLFSPSLKTSTIRSIEGFNVAARDQIGAGWSTGFTLTEELYLTRGEVMSHVQGHPVSASRFRANVIWLGREALVPGRLYKLKLHTAAVPVRVHKLLKVIDASALDGELDKDTVGRHDVADLILETTAPVAFDLSGQVEATGRFVIVDGYEIAGGGIITDVVHDEDTAERAIDRLKHVHWVQSGVGGAARAGRLGQRPALVLFVGRDGVGKRRFARALEEALFAQGHHATLLDGANILLGAAQDETWEATRHELVRRFTEIAGHLLGAGLIVVGTSNAFGLADQAEVQKGLEGCAHLTIEVDPDGHSALPCDLRIRGDEPLDALTGALTALLRDRGAL